MRQTTLISIFHLVYPRVCVFCIIKAFFSSFFFFFFFFLAYLVESTFIRISCRD